ncbi:putative serine protein kinase, PrkA [Desulfacinum hydrothermale DSM 13146]|uniref:Putative serine protein kinase, PrkA n=1 Tax=Desulfacinum hydrothermale DSM 13146 TaxID=1121390 RepID=A0A1W1XCU6_9BACT|nr:serine protein kinase PrkA [Desulfacinum hydrothermale]SMC21700.1 putative serine protein kinase, PrkA [Desulfacinum hydrothermale DSM 13146]
MNKSEQSLRRLFDRIRERESSQILGFQDFLALAARHPDRIFRNVHQRFHDMVMSYIGEGRDEYPNDPESIHFVFYDCSRLFVEGTDHPFFADRLFANRFVNLVSTFRRGAQQNRIYIFEGPHGCGKSTFLNNLLLKFELYTSTEQGACYETLWRIDKRELGAGADREAHYLLSQLRHLVDSSPAARSGSASEPAWAFTGKDILEVPCPSHDNPVLLIPKAYRRDVLEELIEEGDFKRRLFEEKQYEWVFRDQPCTICQSLYDNLLELLERPEKVYRIIHARRYRFNRRLGQGVSVYNPGDQPTRDRVLANSQIQQQLNALLRDSNRVRYLYSRYANTNNGVYALMDVKAHNRERFADLHGIISEGVHKVEDMEENVHSLFLALMNPEDQVSITEERSFADRITYIKIPYILDYKTEVQIYKNIFGEDIERYFLPRVLHNFAKVIISTRLKPQSEAMGEWISRPEKYYAYCDRDLRLLKMEIYTGNIPPWLDEGDRKNFTAKRRHRIIAESEGEGDRGITGRDSQNIFIDFFSAHARPDRLITMDMVYQFFRKFQNGSGEYISPDFLDSLVRLYDYTVLEEVKESLYDYNEERIAREIQNYLFGVNFEPGSRVRCVYTGEELEISEQFFEAVEKRLLGRRASLSQRRDFRRDVQHRYTSRTLSHEMRLEGKPIDQTDLYGDLHERYVHNLKENVLDPFVGNDHFRAAVKDFATEAFRTYDARLRDDVAHLVENLTQRYGYSVQGAKEVTLYVLDKNLVESFRS